MYVNHTVNNRRYHVIMSGLVYLDNHKWRWQHGLLMEPPTSALLSPRCCLRHGISRWSLGSRNRQIHFFHLKHETKKYSFIQINQQISYLLTCHVDSVTQCDPRQPSHCNWQRCHNSPLWRAYDVHLCAGNVTSWPIFYVISSRNNIGLTEIQFYKLYSNNTI